MLRKIILPFFISNLLFFTLPSQESAQSKIQNQNTFFQNAFVNVGKKAFSAVVFIKVELDSPQSYMSEDPFDAFNDEFFKRFFGAPPNKKFNQKQHPSAAGSGCIVSKDGYILTNNHIIKDASSITVTLNNGKEYEAKIIGADPKTDLAVIKIEADNLPYLKFADSNALEIGEWVVAIGAPFQLQGSLTHGVISAKGRQNLRINDLEDFIQTDAAINPGNSGGPLLNLEGNIAGINDAILTSQGNGGSVGIGFAIPSNMAKVIMDQIITNGEVKRGRLGIYLQPIDKEMAEALELDSSEGILIAEVSTNSAAQKAGLKQGDVILEYNAKKIKSLEDFRKEIALMTPGDKVSLLILRNGNKKNIVVYLEEATDTFASSKHSIELGMEVANMNEIPDHIIKQWHNSENLEGVMITSIKYNSLADKAGLKPGMIITQVNHKNIKNVDDFKKVLKEENKKKHLLLLIKYKNTMRFVSIKLK